MPDTLGITTVDTITVIHILLKADHSENDLNTMENELSRVVRQTTLVHENAAFLLTFHATTGMSELMVGALLRIGEEIRLFGGKLHMCMPHLAMDETTFRGLQEFVLPKAGGCIPSACTLCKKRPAKVAD